MPADIDALPVHKSLIDLSSYAEGDFGLEDLELHKVLDDVILVEYVDLSDEGTELKRNGIYIPTNAIQKTWRKARVILTGPLVKYVSVGDIVLFPGNMGITVSNMEISEYGKINKGIFLNESRIFGICKPKQINDCSSTRELIVE